MTEPRPPANRCATVRQKLAETLRTGEYSAHELSRLVSIPEKTVADHLEHLSRSLPGHGERLMVTSPECLRCGYVFDGRARLTRPSRCPLCRGSHLSPPVFAIRSQRSR